MLYRSIILEDDKSTREFLALVLKQRNHEVFAFSSPSICPLYTNAACECPNEEACGDFLITDNQMPGMTGLEFVQRQIEGNCRGAVKNKAIVSGDWTQEEWDLGTRLGCKLFLKPLDLEEFYDWLSERENGIFPHRKLIPVS